jgi:hypothetical protein
MSTIKRSIYVFLLKIKIKTLQAQTLAKCAARAYGEYSRWRKV